LLYNNENFNKISSEVVMKRYGDNLPSPNISEDALSYEHGRNVRVMYGGCGIRFGTFPQPVGFPKKHKNLDILSLFGFRRQKSKKNIG
jgi:hypothetical protein